jgi:6-phospho-beta-glucosidase
MPKQSPLRKIAVIGGGSTYTPELVEGLLDGTLAVGEIVLHDIDAAKLAVVGGLAQRMAAAATRPVPVTLTGDLARALDGADAVITQLRVGGLAARAKDERIPLRYDLPGQETTGPGGFAKALRTVPVILAIDREMAARCQEAWLVNFTNPSGLVTEALRIHGRGRAVGLCNFPLTLKMHAASAFTVEEHRVALAYFGLNHLSWTRVLVDGVDRTEELIEITLTDPQYREITGYAFAPECLRALGLLPSGYLRYYYDTAAMVAQQQAAEQTRAEKLIDLERELLRQYADPALQTKPAGLQQRGGAWYSTAALRLLRDLWSPEGGTHVINVRNDGALPALPDDMIVETPARVAAGAVCSLPTVTRAGEEYRVAGHAIPAGVIDLIRRVKDYELLAVEAAVTGDRAIAAQALAAHPLLDGRHAIIPALLNDLLQAHRSDLPRFFPE